MDSVDTPPAPGRKRLCLHSRPPERGVVSLSTGEHNMHRQCLRHTLTAGTLPTAHPQVLRLTNLGLLPYSAASFTNFGLLLGLHR